MKKISFKYFIKQLEKLEFYDSIGMHELANAVSKRLMQSVDFRYHFYKDNGILIAMDNYSDRVKRKTP